jgi:hypothetical protein
MASKIVLMTALIDQFTTFVTELSEMYPEDADFEMFLTTIRLIKSTNPSLIVKNIYDNTIKYEEKIMKKDEQFFLDSSFDDHKEDVDMDILSKMKQYYSKMNAASKENVWVYCQNIIRLAKAIHSM